MKEKLFIFDLDGTLIHFHKEYLLTETDRILEKIEHDLVHREELEESFSSFEYFRFFAEHLRDELTETFWGHFDWENFPRPDVIPGALELLESIGEKKIPIAIATSRLCSSAELTKELESTGILEFVSHIETRTSEEIHWSDKRGHLKTICEKFSVNPAEVAMVGDIPPDISSARAVGIGTAIAVLSGGIKFEVLEAADPCEVLDDVSKLVKKP